MAEIDVAPGVDDADHRLIGEVASVKAALTQSCAMAERAQIVGTEPAMAAQVLRTFAAGHERNMRCSFPSLNRQIGGLHHLCPLSGFGGKERAERLGRARHRNAAEVAQLALHANVLDAEVNLFV